MECFIKRKNVGRSKCNINISMFNQYLIVPSDFEATEAEAADPAFWQALLFATNPDDRGQLFPVPAKVEMANEESIYADNPIKMVKTRDGQYRMRFFHDVDLCTHKNMRSQSGSNDGRRVVFFDIEGNCIGTENASGNFTGFTLAMYNVEKMMPNNGTDPTYTPAYVCLKDNKQLDDKGWIVDGSFVNELIPLTDVEITVVGVISADTFTVDVKAICDNTAVSGLLAADFVFVDASSAAQNKTVTAHATIPGRYIFTNNPGDFVDGTLDLRAPSLLTTPGYEALDAISINVP